MRKLESGTTYNLASSDNSISAVYMSATLVGDLAWHKFMIGPQVMQFVEINDYLCSPIGNYKVTWP